MRDHDAVGAGLQCARGCVVAGFEDMNHQIHLRGATRQRHGTDGFRPERAMLKVQPHTIEAEISYGLT